jgi:signal transduction histidine kinase
VRQDADRSARVDELAGEIAAAADEATTQARAMIAGLRETAAPELVGAVRAAVTAWSRSALVTVETDLRAVPEPGPDTRRELVAVLGEALANVGRHAGASRVRVELAGSGGLLRLTVRDDGRGFAVPADPDQLARSGRYGLLGMTERLHGVGGALWVRSAPGLGTTLVAEVPVR